jgi:hypothetical protein
VISSGVLIASDAVFKLDHWRNWWSKSHCQGQVIMYLHQYQCPPRGFLLSSQCLTQKVLQSLIALRGSFGVTSLCQISHTELQPRSNVDHRVFQIMLWNLACHPAGLAHNLGLGHTQVQSTRIQPTWWTIYAISSESTPSAADPQSIRVWQRGGGVFVIFIGMEKWVLCTNSGSEFSSLLNCKFKIPAKLSSFVQL